MKIHPLCQILINCLVVYLLFVPGVALASGYTNGNTTLELAELLDKPNPSNESKTQYPGIYNTTIAGKDWFGDFTMTSRSVNASHTVFSGKFKDRELGSDKTCEGNIMLRRNNPGMSKPIVAEVTWQVKSGNNCPSLGTEARLTLTEALPKPDENGDFRKPYTLPWETNGNGMWRSWYVVSSDGSLNCREIPNGKIIQTYKTGMQFKTVGNIRDPFKLFNDVPWFKVENGIKKPFCYVRANSRYIAPVSMPF